MSASKSDNNRGFYYAVIAENVVTVLAAACVFIFAPGWWKLGGIALLLNLNYFRKQERSDG